MECLGLTIANTRIIPNFLIILILFSGCATDKTVKNINNLNLPIETTDNYSDLNKKSANSEEEKTDLLIESIINRMTLEEKIGQLFIISVRDSFNGSRMVRADDYMKNIIETYKPGGIILFTINFTNPEQTQTLIRETQHLSSLPLFVAVDEEGGVVARLGNSERMSVTLLPPAAVIGKTGNTEYAVMASKVISSELKALGFNMNMAPVADVNTNKKNPVIGNRTYSSDPFEAGKMVAAVVTAMTEENMTSVLKHFPGHGDTSGDTHKGDVILEHDKMRLNTIEFVPFKMGIEAGADMVMTAHIKVPLVTGSDLPATMSPVMLKDILRKELGFEGIIITDAMDMGAVTNYWDSDEAALNALLAGVDIILMPSNIKKAINGIKNALEKKIITTERIEESLKRILKVKIARGMFDASPELNEETLSILGSDEHKRIISSIPR
jgi:beta-N-acetylhexosaminidase